MGSPSADLVLDDPAVGEGQPQDRRVGVGPRRDLDQRGRDQLVDQAVRAVDDEEPPVLDDAPLRDDDLVADAPARGCGRAR